MDLHTFITTKGGGVLSKAQPLEQARNLRFAHQLWKQVSKPRPHQPRKIIDLLARASELSARVKQKRKRSGGATSATPPSGMARAPIRVGGRPLFQPQVLQALEDRLSQLRRQRRRRRGTRRRRAGGRGRRPMRTQRNQRTKA